jgi:tetratricopeptide (TPR) repeat protein
MITDTSRPVRPWLLVALGVVLLFATGVGVAVVVQSIRRTRAAQHAEAATARENRQRARIHPPPAPVPQGLPLLGTPGTDAEGYPLQYVDRAGMRALLAARDFEALTSYFEQLQSAFAADPRKEYWPDDAAESFESAEPEILPSLDAWVAAKPDSFAPYLARGSHWLAAAWARRGRLYRDETPDEDMRAMRAAADRAMADFDRALALRSGLVSAMRLEMKAALPISDHARGARMRVQAFAACPGCLHVRTTYLNSLIPRWGGSYPAIQAYVDTLSPHDNPRFRALGGYVDFDLASVAVPGTGPKRFDTVLADVDRALLHGDYWEYLYLRARTLRGLTRFDEALVTLNRADALRPMNPAVLSERAALHANRKEWIAAGRDLLTALRIDPAEPDGKRYATDVLNGLLGLARASQDAGNRQSALDAVQLVLDMCPEDDEARGLRAKMGGG